MTGMDTMIGNRSYRVAIGHKIVGSLNSAPDIKKALEYLEEKGFAGAKKVKVIYQIEEEDLDNLVEANKALTPKVEQSINHNTLAAFARECIRDGKGFDLDVVGLTTLTETTIKENE